jgi:orotidine-5'-phosphate decarboxylase
MGMETLQEVVAEIRRLAPDMPVILDAKVADIGNTNLGYVKTAFDYIEADAITVHPYLGQEAMKPFLDCKDKGIIVLCRTSNPGAGEFQDGLRNFNDDFNRWEFEKHIGREVPESGVPMYQYVGYRVMKHWNANGNCCLVTGATYPEELAQVRKIVGDMPLLIPGVGKQGGDVNAVVKAAGGKRMIINSSSGIIFAEDPRQATRELNKQIDLARL